MYSPRNVAGHLSSAKLRDRALLSARSLAMRDECLLAWWLAYVCLVPTGSATLGDLVIASTQPTLMSSARASISKHPGGAFLAFFYVTSWVLFLPALLGTLGFGLIPAEIPAQPS